jgi:predicted transcriptional regulator YheO
MVLFVLNSIMKILIMSKLNAELTPFLPFAQSISVLLHPQAEVVIHDLATGKIAALLNNFSGRKVGDPSLLEEELKPETLPDYFGPYSKINNDGRKLKSVSTTLRNKKGKAIGLLCINLDVSAMEELATNLLVFCKSQDEAPLPSQLFADDWREKINLFIHQYLKDQQWNRSVLTRAQIKDILRKLKNAGGFKAKNSADHIAACLGISRASVYLHLRSR